MKSLKVYSANQKEIIENAAKLIKKGKILVFPTDTVYGLICDAANKEAVSRLFKIKKRLEKKLVPIFVKNLKMAKQLAEIDKKQEKFLKSVWPGKVTVILKRKKPDIKLYGVAEKTIALRLPNYSLIADLFKKLTVPLVGTSANISGKPATTKIKEVLKQFKSQKRKPDFIIDVENLKYSKPSIIIDLTSLKPKILRK